MVRVIYCGAYLYHELHLTLSQVYLTINRPPLEGRKPFFHSSSDP